VADIRETFKEAWSQALAGVNAAEQEAEKVFTRLADAAGFSADDVKRHARDFGERLTAQRREIEKAIDDATRRAASRFRIPTRADLDLLQQRLDAVAGRLEALEKEKAKGTEEGRA
jgi:polyhydroxyalkanoate synthesis regulator phasin